MYFPSYASPLDRPPGAVPGPDLHAAKFIFRFTIDRIVSEYILMGTLLSFTAAVLVGIATRWLLGLPL